MMACIAFREEDVHGAICSVVGAAESHLAIVFSLHTNQPERGMPKAKPGQLKKNGHVRANSLRALDGRRAFVCSARLYEASLGRTGGLLRSTRLYWPVVLNVCGLQ
jgi:hypothetical protein